jgi:hypothetical protein
MIFHAGATLPPRSLSSRRRFAFAAFAFHAITLLLTPQPADAIAGFGFLGRMYFTAIFSGQDISIAAMVTASITFLRYASFFSDTLIA